MDDRILDESDLLLDAWAGAPIEEVVSQTIANGYGGFVFNTVVVRRMPGDDYKKLLAKYHEGFTHA